MPPPGELAMAVQLEEDLERVSSELSVVSAADDHPGREEEPIVVTVDTDAENKELTARPTQAAN